MWCMLCVMKTEPSGAAKGGVGHAPPPEIGFTRKFLAAPLSYIHKIVHGLAAKYP